jgi:hypothetical protein
MLKQIKWMAISYIMFEAINWTILIVGNKIEVNNLICYEEVYIFPENNKGAWFLFIWNLYFYSFSMFLWYIFYRLPYEHGLITKLNIKSLRMTRGTVKSLK